jgi:hypothetical protein
MSGNGLLSDQLRESIENAIKQRKQEAQEKNIFEKISTVARILGKRKGCVYTFLYPDNMLKFKFIVPYIEYVLTEKELGIVTCDGTSVSSDTASICRSYYHENHEEDDTPCPDMRYYSVVSTYIPGDWEAQLDFLYSEALKKQTDTENKERLAAEKEKRQQEDEELRKTAVQFGIDC